MTFYEIYPKISVYRHALVDASLVYETACELDDLSFEGVLYSKWRDWYNFGRICDVEINAALSKQNFDKSIANFSTKKQKDLVSKEMYLYTALSNVTRKCIDDYVKFNNVAVPHSSFVTAPGLAWYKSDIDTSTFGHTMNFHTDYNIGEWWWPGEKFFLTCTTYINDDYDGGEIVFFVDGELVSYKPEAGDVLVFPSGDPRYPGTSPYYHGVNMVKNGRKFLVRTYLKYKTPQNIDFWSSCSRRYGGDVWKKMAESHAKTARPLYWDEIVKYREDKSYPIYSDLVKRLYSM